MGYYKKFSSQFDVALIFSTCLLLIIWTIPNTIALRNVNLFIGSCLAILVIYNNRSFFNFSQARLMPLFFLGGLFIWVLLHFIFFSLDRNIELNEIKSIWARSLAGALIAIALPLVLYRRYKLINFVNVCLLSAPIINICLYLYASYFVGNFLSPQSYVTGFIFKKIETVFFGSLFVAIASGNIAFLLSNLKKLPTDFKIYRNICLWFMGIFICLISAIISNTKNGVIIALFCILVLVLICIINQLKMKVKSGFIIIIVVSILALTFNTFKIHTKFSDAGWNTLYDDIKIALQIDKYLEWKSSNGAEVLPLNSLGVPVNGSTYMRVSWAVAGVRLIIQYPFGYGSINHSFDLLLQKDQIEHWSHGQTHSGWVDFGLAYGIPGVILLLGSLIAIIFYSAYCVRFNSLNSYVCFFISICFIPLALIAETTWKQYFEATIFYIAFAGALLVDRPTS